MNLCVCACAYACASACAYWHVCESLHVCDGQYVLMVWYWFWRPRAEMYVYITAVFASVLACMLPCVCFEQTCACFSACACLHHPRGVRCMVASYWTIKRARSAREDSSVCIYIYISTTLTRNRPRHVGLYKCLTVYPHTIVAVLDA